MFAWRPGRGEAALQQTSLAPGEDDAAKMGQDYGERKVLCLARASAARFLLRSPDPVERLAWDAVLSEKEAQLGRMFLHVAHGVQLEL